MRLLQALLLLAALISSCASSYNKRYLDDLRKRAAFDLRCDQADLNFTELSKKGDFITSYGVRGCGRQAAYVLDDDHELWLMNTDATRTETTTSPVTD